MTGDPTRSRRDRKPAVAVRVPNWLGDLCMATPALLWLRSQLKDRAELILWAREPLATLCRDCALADDVVAVDRQGKPLAGQPRQDPPDAVIFLTNTLRPAWQAWRLGIPVRVGFGKRLMVRALLTQALREQPPASQESVQAAQVPDDWRGSTTVDAYLRLVEAGLRAAGFQPRNSQEQAEDPRSSRLIPSEASQLGASAWLAEHGVPLNSGVGSRPTLIGFQAGAAYGTAKRWPPEKLASALVQWLSKDPQALAVGLGTPGEWGDLEEVVRAMARVREDGDTPQSLLDRVIIPRRGQSLPEFVALLRSLDLVVANDSGPMHVAVAVGTPCVAIFGPTDWISTGYRDSDVYRLVREPGVECSPCMKRHCPIDHRCMTRIDFQRVVDHGFELLTHRLAHSSRLGGDQ